MRSLTGTPSQRMSSLLQSELSRIRQRNPSFSVRALARKLGIGSTTLSDLIAGKRKISPAMASKILRGLDLPEEEKKVLLSHFERAKPTAFSDRLIYLKEHQFRVIAEWQHFAILSLLETEGCQPTVDFLQKRLGLSRKTVTNSVRSLVELGLLLQKENSELALTGGPYSSLDGVPSEAVRKAHRSDLALAEKALEEISVDRRDFTSMTLAVDTDKLPQARKLIRGFQRRMEALLGAERRNDVYKVSVQLYPVTRQ